MRKVGQIFWYKNWIYYVSKPGFVARLPIKWMWDNDGEFNILIYSVGFINQDFRTRVYHVSRSHTGPGPFKHKKRLRYDLYLRIDKVHNLVKRPAYWAAGEDQLLWE